MLSFENIVVKSLAEILPFVLLALSIHKIRQLNKLKEPYKNVNKYLKILRKKESEIPSDVTIGVFDISERFHNIGENEMAKSLCIITDKYMLALPILIKNKDYMFTFIGSHIFLKETGRGDDLSSLIGVTYILKHKENLVMFKKYIDDEKHFVGAGKQAYIDWLKANDVALGI